jgi:hypothetical protein
MSWTYFTKLKTRDFKFSKWISVDKTRRLPKGFSPILQWHDLFQNCTFPLTLLLCLLHFSTHRPVQVVLCQIKFFYKDLLKLFWSWNMETFVLNFRNIYVNLRKSDWNQASYFWFIGDKISWSDNELPVVVRLAIELRAWDRTSREHSVNLTE